MSVIIYKFFVEIRLANHKSNRIACACVNAMRFGTVKTVRLKSQAEQITLRAVETVQYRFHAIQRYQNGTTITARMFDRTQNIQYFPISRAHFRKFLNLFTGKQSPFSPHRSSRKTIRATSIYRPALSAFIEQLIYRERSMWSDEFKWYEMLFRTRINWLNRMRQFVVILCWTWMPFHRFQFEWYFKF